MSKLVSHLYVTKLCNVNMNMLFNMSTPYLEHADYLSRACICIQQHSRIG